LSTSALRKAVADHFSVPSDYVVCRKGDKWKFALLSFKAVGPFLLMGIEEIAKKMSDFKYKKYEFGVQVEEARAPKQFTRAPEDMSLKNLNDQVTPLWRIPYEQQLERKQKSMSLVLSKYFQSLENESQGNLLQPILPAPLQNGYRNKCEFTFGNDVSGEPCLGFSLGGFRDGNLTVADARDCLHVPAAIKALTDHFNGFLRRDGVSQRLPVFERARKVGFWRILMVREHGGALMAAIQVQDGFLADKEAFNAEMLALIGEFNGTTAYSKVESLFIQYTKLSHHGLSTTEPYLPVEPTKSVLLERLSNLSFQISPSSFFQVNLPATEVLYQTIREFAIQGAVEGKKPVLLDVCCGTGTIGMIMSPFVERVVGIEMVQSAVEDAKLNASLNAIENIEFRCAKIEAVAREVIAAIPAGTPIVVVLDPPRSGVHADVIKAIRACQRITRVVFVACNPDAAVGNFTDLSRPTSNAFSGSPFELSKAVPVDMFPHTEHCELVLQFDRKQ
jgi:tRNA (uracil-5-)-methyltransferase